MRTIEGTHERHILLRAVFALGIVQTTLSSVIIILLLFVPKLQTFAEDKWLAIIAVLLVDCYAVWFVSAAPGIDKKYLGYIFLVVQAISRGYAACAPPC